MPANDTYWWNQKTLNIVFALSSVVMLLSVILMMQKDHRQQHHEAAQGKDDVQRLLIPPICIICWHDFGWAFARPQ